MFLCILILSQMPALSIAQKERFIERFMQMNSFVVPNSINQTMELINHIRELKKEKDAILLSHYYMPAELQILEEEGGVADFVGDSLGLSLEAVKASGKNIIFCGVRFMAETAAILNPSKKVLIPDMEAGCSLASGISAQDVIGLKQKYPGVPVIAYINTYAETKAECDIICTSRNALKIAQSFPNDRLIFVPDEFMGKNLREVIYKETGKELIVWNAKCEVHEQFTKTTIHQLMESNPEAEVLVHWEVPDEAVKESLSKGKGIVGSTSDIISYVSKSDATEFILGSECDLGATLRGLYKDKIFITPCVKCPYMKKINLQNTLDALMAIGTKDEERYLVKVPEPTRTRAELPLRRMLEFS